MATIVQKGTAVKIGFGNVAYTGYVLQSATVEATGEQKILRGTDNETMTVLVEDLGKRLQVEVLILDATSLTAAPAKGSTVTIDDYASDAVPYRVEESSIALQAEEARLNLTLIKEVSMTYS